MKYAILGDEDTVLGFEMVGVSGRVVRDADEAQSAFATLLEDKEVGIVIITERVAEMMRATVDRYLFTMSFPLIVEIPDRTGTLPGKPGIREMVNAAIGIRV
ncbi:MAG: V-type ATP synthase subunit F [Sedimentisphaerales bacterium]|nr:V-type ATP synthase subunit F [Sedimentisphaerales bacterium]